jgi:multidrug transporter EmrE-like cation transporter
MNHLVLILVSVLLTAGGQLFFKQGMMTLNNQQQQTSLWKLVGFGLLNGYVILGFLFFGTGAVLWLAVLAKEEVGYAYSMSSLGYVIVLLGSYAIFHEPLSVYRVVGVSLIIFGVIFIELSR